MHAIGGGNPHCKSPQIYVMSCSPLRHQNSVQDIQNSLNNVIVDPRFMGNVMKTHEMFTQSIHDTAELSGRKKRKRAAVDELAQEHREVLALRHALEAVRLKSWP